jgi:16S rRNA (cytosine967-C5)-methyltransferase
MTARSARTEAARCLAAILDGRALHQVLPAALTRCAAEHRALLQSMLYGALRQSPLLEGYIGALLDKPLRRKDHDIQALLLLGAYQILFMRTPTHAAVSETVATAQALKKPWAKGLVNGVLRQLIREQTALTHLLSEAQRAAAPEWLYAQLLKDWPEDAAQILEAGRSHPPLILRANRIKTSRKALMDEWQREGIACSAGPAPESILLGAPVDVFALPGFNDGLCSVQDTSAQWAALWLNPQPGERVLDACAAPGGKACHIAELQPNLASLNAWDINDERLARVTENQNRLGLSFETACVDICQPPQASRYDAVLVDAPCSASGVLRRNPDVKLLRRAEDIAGFAEQQKRILAGAWEHVAPGGRLLYCTCSVLRQENDDVVAAFVAEGQDRSVRIINSDEGVATAMGRQLLPDPVGGDGLFYALLSKAA